MEPILRGWMKPRNHVHQGNIQNMVRHSTDAYNRHFRHGTQEVTSENFIVYTDVLQKPQFEDVTFSPLFTLRPEIHSLSRFSVLISRYTVPTRLKFEKIAFLKPNIQHGGQTVSPAMVCNLTETLLGHWPNWRYPVTLMEPGFGQIPRQKARGWPETRN